MSRVRRDHLRCRSATWISMCGYTRDVVIYSRFHRNPLMTFGATGVEVCKFPLLSLLGFTTACTTVQTVTIRDYAHAKRHYGMLNRMKYRIAQLRKVTYNIHVGLSLGVLSVTS